MIPSHTHLISFVILRFVPVSLILHNRRILVSPYTLIPNAFELSWCISRHFIISLLTFWLVDRLTTFLYVSPRTTPLSVSPHSVSPLSVSPHSVSPRSTSPLPLHDCYYIALDRRRRDPYRRQTSLFQRNAPLLRPHRATLIGRCLSGVLSHGSGEGIVEWTVVTAGD